MPELSRDEIAAAVGGAWEPRTGAAPAFADFQFDTRAVKPGSLFFALRSAGGDGHDHLRDLRAFPGAAAVVRRDFAAAALRRDFAAAGRTLPLLRVSDPLRAAQDLAARVRDRLRGARFVGVTGSAGKTTTKEFLHRILSARWRSFRSPQNWNNWIGLPFSLLRLNGREQAAVFELAMSDPGIGEIDRLAAILRPDVAVLLNVFPVHLEFLKTVANAARAKAEILNHLGADGCALVNGDLPVLRRAVRGRRGQILFFGQQRRGNDVVLERVTREGDGSRLRISFFGIAEEFTAPLVSRTQAENLFAAILAARQLGMKHDEIRQALPGLAAVAGRGQFRRHGRWTIVDETYNSNPEALMRTLAWVDNEFPRHKTAVLGDMLELGAREAAFHRRVGRFFAGLRFERLLTVGRRAEAIAAAARLAGFPARRIACFADAPAAGAWLRARLDPRREAALLFKGSRGVALEKAVAELTRG